MRPARVVLDPAFVVGEVDRRLFGSFVEHLGRCVYGGIYDPSHPSANDEGFRRDVVDLTRELGVSLVRYPGGNFVSAYRWEDGIGPREQRPTRLDPAWQVVETNAVGVDEFMSWAESAQVEPMMAVNLGTRGIQEACDLLEYCNHPGGSYWSDQRRRNGAVDPYGVRLWCLGNEMDGPWQVGHKTADEYGRLAAETAKAMRRIDPDVELVACGSSNSRMPTFADWEATVLGHCHDVVDCISMHVYYENRGDLQSFLASAVDMDRFIDSVVATCDHVAARRRSNRRLRISFDEWNVWYESQERDVEPKPWTEAPAVLQEHYTVADAVVVGDMLLSLLRHADRVAVGCQAQLVNVLAPIVALPGEPAWRQTIFHPFAQAAAHARGTVLRLAVDAPVHDTEEHGEAETLSAVATYDENRGEVALFMVNRDPEEGLDVSVDLRSLVRSPSSSQDSGASVTPRLVGHEALTDDDPYARAGADAGESPQPRPVTGTVLDHDHVLRARLPAVSWNVIRIALTH